MTVHSDTAHEPVPASFSKYTHPVALTDNGRTIGYYVPLPSFSVTQADLSAMKDASSKVSALLDERGLTEDDILSAFDEARKESSSE